MQVGGHGPQQAVASAVFAPDLLRGRVALVTGGGTGLGRAAARALLSCGATVVIAGRRPDVLALACDELGERCSWVAGDVRTDAERLVTSVLERCGRFDVLVNNAGGQWFAPAEQISAKGFRTVTGLNVAGTERMSRAAVELAFAPSRGGTIVNVTLSPHHGFPGMAHSSAARAAVEAMTRAHARDWATAGVNVIAIAAGHFETDALRKYPEPVRQSAARSVPLGRLGHEAEHAWLVALCASPIGRTLSGTVLTLDGGRDNWFGPWPPPALVGEDGTVPAEERR